MVEKKQDTEFTEDLLAARVNLIRLIANRSRIWREQIDQRVRISAIDTYQRSLDYGERPGDYHDGPIVRSGSGDYDSTGDKY